MKKVTALVLSMIMCLLSVPCTILAEEETESTEWFSVSIQMLKEDLENGGYVEDGKEQYVDAIIQDGCLLIDLIWLQKALHIVINNYNGPEQIKLRKNLESQLIYNFTVGSDEMYAVSPYLGEIKVKLGSSVIRDHGKVFVPFAMFASIFNAEFYTAGSNIVLYPPKETVVDVMHTELQKYLFDVVEDSGLSYGERELASKYGKLYRKIKSFFQGTVNLDIDKIKESLPQDTGYFSDILARALCTDSADELEANSQQLSLLSSGCGIIASACAETAEKVSDGLEAVAGQAFENWVNAEAKTKQIGNISFDEYMDLCKDSAQKFQKAQNSKKISSLISKGCEAADISMNLFSIYFGGFVEYVVLSNEISSFQQEDVDAVKRFISQYNKSSGMSTSSSVISNIKDKASLYDGKSTNIFENDELLSEICKSVGHATAGFIVGEYSEGAAKMLSYCFPGLKNYSSILFQLQLVSFGWDAAEMLVNQVTGNSLESLDVLNAALYANLLEKDTADIAEDARNSGDMEVYRQLEWMRLKSCYITRQFVMKFYEPQKILHPEEYNTVYEQEKKICDEITRLMAVLKNGLVGSTQESLDSAYENCKAANQELLENSIFRNCKGKVTDEDGNPVRAGIFAKAEENSGLKNEFAQGDDNGEYTISLRPGKYTIVADTGSKEYESFSMEIEVPDWNTVEYEIPIINLKNNNATKVVFDRKYVNSYEYAIITGKDDANEEIWTITTPKYECAELDNISEIGVNYGIYYYVENGSIVALNLADGKQIWKNDDFNGSGTAYAFGNDGTLYICGYYGPDFFAVSQDGKTLKRIKSFDSDYFWPYKVEYLDDKVAVTLEGSYISNITNTVFHVNLNDYSYSKSDEQDSDISFDDKIESIRSIYYDTQEHLSDYTKNEGTGGMLYYFDGDILKKVVVPPGVYDESKYEGADRYTVEYFYNNDYGLVFTYVYDGSEEYRYYVYKNKCIRYIDDNGDITDWRDENGMPENFCNTKYFYSLGIMEPHWANLW